MADWSHTSDLPDDFFRTMVGLSERLEASPLDLLSCWMSESNVSSKAHNAGGHAVGIFQIIPSTLAGLHFQGTWEDYLQVGPVEQLKWAEKYYSPHRGKLVSPGACYLATFLPALMAYADIPDHKLCGADGPMAWAYRPNSGAFDPTRRGFITVQDLTDRIERVTHGARWDEIVERMRAAASFDAEDTIREVAIVTDDDRPVVLLPDPIERDPEDDPT